LHGLLQPLPVRSVGFLRGGYQPSSPDEHGSKVGFHPGPKAMTAKFTFHLPAEVLETDSEVMRTTRAKLADLLCKHAIKLRITAFFHVGPAFSPTCLLSLRFRHPVWTQS